MPSTKPLAIRVIADPVDVIALEICNQLSVTLEHRIPSAGGRRPRSYLTARVSGHFIDELVDNS